MKRYNRDPFFIKLFNWEYWPFELVYFPVFFYWLWLSAKAKSFFFFNTANPTIKNGGYLMESKFDIYQLIPNEYYPKTIFFPAASSTEMVYEMMKKKNLLFPVIAKPDIGMKGKGVKKIYDEKQLSHYIQGNNVNFLIQEFIPYENEAGIFYCRFPNQDKGFISGIVLKDFLSVTGDGFSTIKELIIENERSLLQLKPLLKEYNNKLDVILPEGEKMLLVPYGNHARGAKFTDGSHLTDKELTNAIHDVCSKIKGFYFGRLDIRYSSWDELKNGNFSIIELNGAGSEPTHIYDPKHSIFFAWKEILRHLNILYKISQINHQELKLPYISFTEGLQLLKEHVAYQKLLG
jgi:hypothetical protein